MGKLISLESIVLVWYRMGIATLLILVFLAITGFRTMPSLKSLATMGVAGFVIVLHWLTFFEAIKVSNVSMTLATMSTGALFAALMEPIWYQRKFLGYEIVFGLLVMAGLYLIFRIDTQYGYGMFLALISAFLAAVFSLINGKLVHKEEPSVIAFFEMVGGMALITPFLFFRQGVTANFFDLTKMDWLYLVILASVCTAYAFIASVKVMRFISPYTVMLTTNLEPVYGIFLAFLILGESEKMNPFFYVGALVIVATVIANGILKNRSRLKKQLLK